MAGSPHSQGEAASAVSSTVLESEAFDRLEAQL